MEISRPSYLFNLQNVFPLATSSPLVYELIQNVERKFAFIAGNCIRVDSFSHIFFS